LPRRPSLNQPKSWKHRDTELAEGGGQRTEVRGQRSEVGSRRVVSRNGASHRAGDRSARRCPAGRPSTNLRVGNTETLSSRRTQGGGQRTEGGRRSEVRGQRSERSESRGRRVVSRNGASHRAGDRSARRCPAGRPSTNRRVGNTEALSSRRTEARGQRALGQRLRVRGAGWNPARCVRKGWVIGTATPSAGLGGLLGISGTYPARQCNLSSSVSMRRSLRITPSPEATSLEPVDHEPAGLTPHRRQAAHRPRSD
jgi:hypothetical protein